VGKEAIGVFPGSFVDVVDILPQLVISTNEIIPISKVKNNTVRFMVILLRVSISSLSIENASLLSLERLGR
jgi:hypothetical protein